jgi:hypothetical protein
MTPQERSRDEFCIVTTLGERVRFDANRLVSIKSIRIPKEVREALTEITKEHKLIRELEEKKSEITKKIDSLCFSIEKTQKSLTHLSGFYTMKEVENKVYDFNFRISGSRTEGNSIWLNLQQSSDGDRYSKPDVSRYYPFVYQEYDGVCFLREDLAPKAYKEYVAKNAPQINVALKKLSDDVTQSVDVGDKYIYATTDYWVKFKNGLTIKDVDKMFEALKG